MVSSLCVTSNVFAPILADEHAASVPAWPPPTTITSYVGDGDVIRFCSDRSHRRVVALWYDARRRLHVRSLFIVKPRRLKQIETHIIGKIQNFGYIYTQFII